MLRVTQYDRGGDIHGEHVEPDIPGVRSAVRVHGDAEVLTVSRCAAPVTQWWSWSVTRPGCRHDSARAGGRCSADPGGREVAGQAEAPQQRPQVRPAKPIAGVGGVRGRGDRVQRVMQRRGVRAGSAGSVPPITPSWNIAKQRISSARQRRRRSQPRTVATGTPRSAPIRTQPAPPSRRQAGGRSPPGHRHAGAHTTTAARCAYGGRSGSGPGPAAAAWSRRRAAGSPVPGRGPTGPAGRCRKMGRPAGRPPDRRRRQWHRRTTARQAFQNTMATMPCRHRQDRASPAAPITRICAWHGSCCYAPAGAQIRRVRARRVVTLGS